MRWVSRLVPVLCLAVMCLCGYGQTGGPDTAIDEFDFWPSPPDRAQGPLGPAHVNNPRFNVDVLLQSGHWRYAGHHEYKGAGELLLPASNSEYRFSAACAYSFSSNMQSYTARWVVPGKKLELLMSKPGANSVKRCRVRTTPAPM
jgi:hypothetical protein